MTTHFWAVPKVGVRAVQLDIDGEALGRNYPLAAAVNGDAGFWYHIAEVETAVRWRINAVTVVNNNGGGNQSKRGFDRAYGGQQTEKARELWTFGATDFARLAEDMGALGLRVEKAADFAPALARALAANRPAVIDVVTDIEAIAPAAVS
jgi:acetolactate synthase-1/2/3 large subunit